MNIDCNDTTIPVLGESRITSPIKNREETSVFISDADQVTIDVNLDRIKALFQEGRPVPSFEMGGPREKIFFNMIVGDAI